MKLEFLGKTGSRWKTRKNNPLHSYSFPKEDPIIKKNKLKNWIKEPFDLKDFPYKDNPFLKSSYEDNVMISEPFFVEPLENK